MKSVNEFIKFKKESKQISVITCYDYSTAKLVNKSDIDSILIGDTVGMVYSGYESTLPVTVDEMIYHCKAVKRGAPDKVIILDMPYLSYHISPEDALQNAGKMLKKTGCSAVKLEGGEIFATTIKKLVNASIPVMGHLGFTPQSIKKFGGHKVQGRGEESSAEMIKDAKILEEAGVFAIVLELVPEKLAGEIASQLQVPVIGIGAGRQVDGQVLVINDVLGLDEDFNPKFLKKYRNFSKEITSALNEFNDDVKNEKFPEEKNCFN